MKRILALLLAVTMVAVFFVHAHNTPHVRYYTPNHAPKHVLFPKFPGLSQHVIRAKSLNAWYVRGVVLRDTGQDVSALLNLYGDRYGVPPYGLAAVMGTESGWRAIADRYGIWPDVSHGSMQFTDATAEQYGVCGDDASCRTWLDVPGNSIYLAARFFSEIKRLTCLSLPVAYVAYNAGPGYGCNAYFYYHPTGQAYDNYYGNFIPNYNYVLTYFLGAPVPPPPAPPKKHISWHRAVRLAHPRLGAFTRQHWVPRPHAGFNVYRYRHGVALCWPRYHRCAVRVQ